MSTPVADAFGEINKRILEIRAEAVQRCPNNTGRFLYECLRSISPCAESCPLRGDWIGPQSAFVVPVADETEFADFG